MTYAKFSGEYGGIHISNTRIFVQPMEGRRLKNHGTVVR